MDRKIAPKIQAIRKVDFPDFKSHVLENGIPLHILSSNEHDVIKLELVFKAGRSRELEPLTSKATSGLLKEGSQNYNSEQLAEKIDFYGSSISSTSSMDTSSVTLFCAKKHFQNSLEILQEILFRPVFPADELEKYKTRAAERLQLELSKNNVVAYRKITEKIFGENHCYGYNSYPESYKNIQIENLLFHYQHAYTDSNCQIYVSGYVDDNVIDSIDKALGLHFGEKPIIQNYTEPIIQNVDKILIPGNKLQNSLKLGKKLFNRQHSDFYSFFMLNTILGGYFGARLMSSIREEKGYTYNIYSVMDSMEHDGYFYISTDVGSEYYEKTLEAIEHEIALLQSDLIGDKELDMAKNYVLGNFLSMLDGPLKSSKILKMLLENGLTTQDFQNMVEKISVTTSQELLDTANKYLNFNDLHQVSVGDF